MNAGKTILIATAAAGLFLTGAVGARAAEQAGGDSKVMCEGVNACKGQGACATAHNECAGKNGCKAKGAVEMSTGDCKAKGGKAQEKKM